MADYTNGWHLKKEIQVSHLITTAGMVLAAVLYAAKIEQRVALLESSMVQQHERDDRQDKASAESITLLRAHLERIEAKLDRLVERGTR